MAAITLPVKETPQHPCAVCGEIGKWKACGRCRSVYYCSKDH